MSTDIDWAAKPEPWCWVGPQFQRECEAISAGPANIGGHAIRDRRIALGLTQAQLANLAGYHGSRRQNIACGVESGVKGPAAERILAALDRLEAQAAQ